MDSYEKLALIENRAYYDITTTARLGSEVEGKEALDQTRLIIDGVQSIRTAPSTMDICLS